MEKNVNVVLTGFRQRPAQLSAKYFNGYAPFEFLSQTASLIERQESNLRGRVQDTSTDNAEPGRHEEPRSPTHQLVGLLLANALVDPLRQILETGLLVDDELNWKLVLMRLACGGKFCVSCRRRWQRSCSCHLG
jgi:hypothetical protein